MQYSFKKQGLGVLLVCLSVASSYATAAENTVTLEFSPNPSNADSNRFINTTENYGICRGRPSSCGPNEKSMRTNITNRTVAPMVAEHANPRDGAVLSVPVGWHDVQVTNGVDVATVRFRVKGFGGRYETTPLVTTIVGHSHAHTAHGLLWHGGRWFTAPSPCTNSGHENAAANYYEFSWNFPTSGSGVCAKTTRHDFNQLYIQMQYIKYEVEGPNPHSMASGEYTGSIDFSYGPGGDFDFGDNLLPSDNLYRVNIIVNVNHVLEAKFPWGTSSLALRPQGGWMQWIQRGRRPEKLSIDQGFQFSTNNAFKMHLECQYPLGNHCGIENGSGHQVPVDTRVTLPMGINDASGQPVNRQLLSPIDKAVFTPTQFVTNSKASLHFEVGRDDVQEMTNNHAGSQYSGDVTVVWDSDILAP